MYHMWLLCFTTLESQQRPDGPPSKSYLLSGPWRQCLVTSELDEEEKGDNHIEDVGRLGKELGKCSGFALWSKWGQKTHMGVILQAVGCFQDKCSGQSREGASWGLGYSKLGFASRLSGVKAATSRQLQRGSDCPKGNFWFWCLLTNVLCGHMA